MSTLSSDRITSFYAEHPKLLDSFWSRIDTKGGDREQCWPWLGGVSRDGYGSVALGDRRVVPHRVAYVLAFGFLSTEALLLHECDTPLCCNPYCTSPGTQAGNMQDAEEKGRRYNGGSKRKLAPDQEAALVARAGFESIHALASEFHVNARTVSRMVSRAEAHV